MPADEAIKIIKSIYESNRMVDIEITIGDALKATFIKATECNIFSGMKNSRGAQRVYKYEYTPSDIIIIHSIIPIIPVYSVGDEVMILATGEIGSISKLRDEAREKPIEINNDTDQFYHRSEICKIA